jgi:sec-independent protein translocase protein TatC
MAKGDFVDVPMSLGDHLEELRRRLKWPIIALVLLFFAAFAFENHIQQIFAQPLAWAIALNPENAKTVGLPTDGSIPKLMVLDVWEAPMVSMKVSFYAAFFLAFPILVYHLWMFIGVGLVARERRLAFLFVPAGIMFFYAGTLLGYYIGVPYFYSFMIKWAAHNPILVFSLQLSTYHQNFVMMTMIFGLIADIPWLVMVLVRVGFVTVPQLLKHWKVAIFVNTAIAAIVAPPDFFSMVAMMIPLYLLYFLGVGLSALMMRHHSRLEKKEQAAELARMAAEERAAHEAQAHQVDAHQTQPEVFADPAQPSSEVSSTDQSSPNAVIEEPKPVPRGAITDDLVAGDHAPSSTDQPSPDVTESATAIGSTEPSPSAPTEPPPTLGNDESGTGGEMPRKDDDRG